MNSKYDVVVIGARAAGASTAMLLARSGLKVLAVDRGTEGSDTLSTHALMRGGVLQLHRWGLSDRIRATGAPPIRTTTFHYDGESIAVPIKARDGVEALMAPRRTVLDAVLVNAARAAGADVVHRVTALYLLRDETGRVRGVQLGEHGKDPVAVAADLVIGADGTHSRTAHWVGSEKQVAGRHAAAVVYGYFAGIPADGFHWYFRPGTSVGVIPTNRGTTCVFAGMPQDRFRAGLAGGLEDLHRQVLEETAPSLAETVAGAPRDGKYRGFAGAQGFIRRPWGPGWALVGDAGYFRDPITAHGITDAFRDAELLARAVLSGTDRGLADYAAGRDSVARGMLETSDAIASFAWDLEQIKILHVELNRRMNAGVRLLGELPPLEDSQAVAGNCPVTGGFPPVTPATAAS